MDQEQIDKILEEHRTKNFVQRILNPENAPTPLLVEGQKQTHFMSAEYLGEGESIPAVFPTVIETEEGELSKLSLKEAKDHALNTGEYIEFDSIIEADTFSQKYKGSEDSGFNKFYSPEGDEGLMSGETMKKEMKKGYYHGGMMMPEMIVGIDEVSGNEIPPGADAENVRDDIPAALSEGELVIPADVVRYHGLKMYEDMRVEAKMGLMSMKADGQIRDIEEEEYEEEDSEEETHTMPDGTEMPGATHEEYEEEEDGSEEETPEGNEVEKAELVSEEEEIEFKEDSEGVEEYPSKTDDFDTMEVGDNSIIKLFIKGLMGK
jgi:hypothetical protein